MWRRDVRVEGDRKLTLAKFICLIFVKLMEAYGHMSKLLESAPGGLGRNPASENPWRFSVICFMVTPPLGTNYKNLWSWQEMKYKENSSIQTDFYFQEKQKKTFWTMSGFAQQIVTTQKHDVFSLPYVHINYHGQFKFGYWLSYMYFEISSDIIPWYSKLNSQIWVFMY